MKGLGDLSIKKKILLYLSPSFIVTILAVVFVFFQYQSLIKYQNDLEEINKIEKNVYHAGWKIYELSLYESQYIDIKVDENSKKFLNRNFTEVQSTLNTVNLQVEENFNEGLNINQGTTEAIGNFLKTINLVKDKTDNAIYLTLNKEQKDGKSVTSFVIKESIESTNKMVSAMIGNGLAVTDIYKGLIKKEIDSVAKTLYYMIIFAGILIISISIFVAQVIGRSMHKSIGAINEQVKKMANGNLNVEFGKISKDEIGTIKSSLLTMRDGLRSLIRNISDNKNKIDVFSSTLLTTSKKSEEFATNVEGNIERINNNINKQNISVTDISSTTQELSASMEQISAGVEMVFDNANTVNTLSLKGQEETGAIQKQMDQIYNHTSELSSFSNKLINNIKQITNISGRINEITDQTKILSLNATIEAARAGEFGKGFAVVANEVRQLATETSSLSDEISSIIKETENTANTTFESLTSSVNEVKEGKRKIDIASTTFANIAEHITSLTHQINEIVIGIKQINQGTEETVHTVGDLAGNSDQLSHISQEVLENVVEQTSLIRSLTDEVESLKKITTELNQSVEKFEI